MFLPGWLLGRVGPMSFAYLLPGLAYRDNADLLAGHTCTRRGQSGFTTEKGFMLPDYVGLPGQQTCIGRICSVPGVVGFMLPDWAYRDNGIQIAGF